jgi:aryl-alcohol dehydrogenase-like predicted oxidoreductase
MQTNEDRETERMHKVTLGRTGIESAYLSIGTGTVGGSQESNQTRLGHAELVDLMGYAHDQGVTSLDLAGSYGSHPHAADHLRAVGRDNVVVTTKTGAKDPDTARADIEKFLGELGTDRLDVVLMHCMGASDWPTTRREVMDVFSEYKRQGVIGAVGVSCHDHGALQSCAGEPWVDLVLARINYDGVRMDASPDEIVATLSRIHAAGKAVCGMKIVGQGPLTHDYRDAIKYVYDLDCVDMMTIGMESRAEVDANVARIEELHGMLPPPTATARVGAEA